MKNGLKFYLLSCGATLAFGAGTAFAQDGAGQPAQASEHGEQVAEIIVTAQKRDERLQDVPVAVTAVSSSQLSTANITNVTDLKLVAPALLPNTVNGTYLVNNLRGIGTFAFGAGVESPVATYIDGVYQASPYTFATQLNNIASVEVLKGPQGTLFGRNATGGLVQINTVDPTDVATGKFSVGYANYDTWTGAGYVAGGIADDLAADFAVWGSTQGRGYGKNIANGTDTYRDNHNYTLRSKVVWTPGDNTKVTLIGNYFNGKGNRGLASPEPGKVSGWVGTLQPDLGYGNNVDNLMMRKVTGGSGSLKIEHDFGSVNFSSISAFQKAHFRLDSDIDFSPIPIANLEYDQYDRQISQEVQLSSAGSSRLKWTVGLFYFDSKATSNTIIGFPAPALIFDDTVKTRSGAIYGQASYEIADRTNLTVGGRYTIEKRQEVDPFVNFLPPLPDQSVTEKKPSWRASIDHRFSDQVLVYASFNTGFRSGGYNSTDPGRPAYRPETITAYEVGAKTDLLDKRLRINLAGFYYKYKDIQVQALNLSSVYVINGASAEVYGLDADFTAVLAEGLTLSGGVNWISPKFGAFPGCQVSSPVGGVPLVTGSCDGNQVPGAPKFTFSSALTYNTDVANGKLNLGANVYHNSGTFFEGDNVLFQGPYTLLGASAKWTSASGFSIGVFGKNLTNRRIKVQGQSQPNGTALINYDQPRTYGVTFGFEF